MKKTIFEAVKSMKNGSLTSTQLLNTCLERVEKAKDLQAIVTLNDELCKIKAAALDAKREELSGDELGPLHGIPVAVKDNFSTAGIRTTCASRILSDYVPNYTATAVQKLLSAGGLLLAKTNMDEFAMGAGSVESHMGEVRNPWNTDRVAGGSSGGSIVSVACGAVFAALGSDTGGSVRNPACFCGVVGYKPSYGLISRHGLISLENSMDTVGIAARYVDDVAYILDIIAGWDAKDSTSVKRPVDKVQLDEEPSVKGLNVGIPYDFHAPGTSREVIDEWSRIADEFERAGANVVSASLPSTQFGIDAYYVLCKSEVASNMARYDGIEYGFRSNGESTEQLYASTRAIGLNDAVRERILAGNYFLLSRNYKKYYEKAQKVRRKIANEFNDTFNSGIDVLLTPAVLEPAPRFDWFKDSRNRVKSQDHDIYTITVNLAGLPAVVVPTGLNKENLPIGLQLITPYLNDVKLLNIAKWLENYCSFKQFVDRQMN
ncbi:DgyrCDS11789 [Dimorphilus gyrociliatus]|uniref:Glutamyl-tRNA(Gln) amidotransferase subunit A, mitochondrial n=1 Tax=Dimorphilus gyrociliatus TaxID=2664684 RepID=A0A7I8W5E5_9ANNE|nr:DgyrCDS11789 [Dimorphilus gyrociliatus]